MDVECGKSSTWREMKGVALALRAYSPKLRGKRVKVFTNNKGVEAVVRKGSIQMGLQNLSVHIAEMCTTMCINLQLQ